MKKAFTILELLVVVAIIVILAITAIPNFVGRIQDAEDAKFLAEVNSVQKATSLFREQEGYFPTEQGEQPTDGYPMNIKFSLLVGGGYLTKLPSFSYWYIDNRGFVVHTESKLETIVGSSDTIYTQYQTGHQIKVKSDYRLTVEHPENKESMPASDRLTGIELNKYSMEIQVGETEVLTYTLLPVTADSEDITWNSSNPIVASVGSDGTVVGLTNGTADISATTNDGNIVAKCVVVVATKATSITLNKNTTTLGIGSTERLVATVYPENAADKTLVWVSSAENIITVDQSGMVTAVSPGTGTITATTADGSKTAECTVTVAPNVTGVTLNKSTTTIVKSFSEIINETVSPSNAINTNVAWESSNTGVATVDGNGRITGVSVGTAIITVKTVDGNKTATCTVTVVEAANTTFNYTGAVQTFMAAVEGEYKLEVWGAQGGEYLKPGAYGGYATGLVRLTAGKTVNVYVGEKGDKYVSGGSSSGGWNGGGDGSGAGAGGGATDMRIGGTALSNRVIVAGGGGGRYSDHTPGAGGGASGGNGAGSNGKQALGGTQTAPGGGGQFGKGGSSSVLAGGGGGGGYYGGGGNSGTANVSGGGGSGYIGGVTSGTMTSNSRAGNGQAKITYIGP